MPDFEETTSSPRKYFYKGPLRGTAKSGVHP